MIACLGETTGREALEKMLHYMRSTEEGQRILVEKPRINTRTVDMEALKKMPEHTFGYTYVKFMEDNVQAISTQTDTHTFAQTFLEYVTLMVFFFHFSDRILHPIHEWRCDFWTSPNLRTS